MKVLILGGDGYLGWPTAMYLSKRGHDVLIVDNMAKRRWEAEVNATPLFHVPTIKDRISLWHDKTSLEIKFEYCDISESPKRLNEIFDSYIPDTVIHYAEQPSAPYSHISARTAIETQRNNILGTLALMYSVMHSNPPCHIIKLGTMGEYGTPDIDIEEGWLDVTHNGRTARVLYPKKAGSIYHLSKCHDSHNLEFGCRVFNLRVTDLNQGVVYGIDTDETWLDPGLGTSFHYDAIFGTVLNRFLAQAAVGHALTVYGAGTQTRGFLNIKDTLQCVELALENPADQGEFRVFNQFTEQYSVIGLASIVRQQTGCEIQHIPNPRVEDEDHYYNAKHTGLPDLGLKPNFLTAEVIGGMYKAVKKHRKNIHVDRLLPTVKWRG
jgi:UDP-sulfoquinovose synthase